MVVVWVASHSGNSLGLDDVGELLDGAADLSRSAAWHEATEHVLELFEEERTTNEIDPALPCEIQKCPARTGRREDA
jgi:hypothetical protein